MPKPTPCCLALRASAGSTSLAPLLTAQNRAAEKPACPAAADEALGDHERRDQADTEHPHPCTDGRNTKLPLAVCAIPTLAEIIVLVSENHRRPIPFFDNVEILRQATNCTCDPIRRGPQNP